MRALAPDMDPTVVADVDARLDDVVVRYGVAVPWAIESGSRAWGFPSPDSDYDCRFFFVRRLGDYATPWPARDVVETPLDAVLDVNGWDLAKAVRLVVGGNATVGEWLRSPLVYRGDPEFRDALLEVVSSAPTHAAVLRHYLHVGRAQWTRAGADRSATVALKRVFYALRPALVLHWMARHADLAVPVVPMALPQLVEQAPPPAAVVDEVAALVALKATTRELGEAPVPPAIRAFVVDQFAAAADRARTLPGPDADRRAGARRAASAAFSDLVRRWGPSNPA